MPPRQKRTWFTYHESQDPDEMQLGNLVFDYANPLEYSPFQNSTDVAAQVDWASFETLDYCYQVCHEDADCSFGFGLQDLLNFSRTTNSVNSTVVVGSDGKRVHIKNIDKYLQKALESTECRDWIRFQFTGADRVRRLQNWVGWRPRLWLLTGVYTIKDARSYSILQQQSSTDLSTSVPLPDPTGGSLAALLDLKVGAKIDSGNGRALVVGSSTKGERVWAAQWHRVHVEYKYVKNFNQSLEGGPLQGYNIKLLEGLSVDKKRGPQGEDQVQVVSLYTEFEADDVDDGVKESDSHLKVLNNEYRRIVDEYDDVED